MYTSTVIWFITVFISSVRNCAVPAGYFLLNINKKPFSVIELKFFHNLFCRLNGFKIFDRTRSIKHQFIYFYFRMTQQCQRIQWTPWPHQPQENWKNSDFLIPWSVLIFSIRINIHGCSFDNIIYQNVSICMYFWVLFVVKLPIEFSYIINFFYNLFMNWDDR